MRLEKSRVKYDLRKFSFSNRVVNIWNSLPNWVVSANTTNTFKARLDKFWHNQASACARKLRLRLRHNPGGVHELVKLFWKGDPRFVTKCVSGGRGVMPFG